MHNPPRRIRGASNGAFVFSGRKSPHFSHKTACIGCCLGAPFYFFFQLQTNQTNRSEWQEASNITGAASRIRTRYCFAQAEARQPDWQAQVSADPAAARWCAARPVPALFRCPVCRAETPVLPQDQSTRLEPRLALNRDRRAAVFIESHAIDPRQRLVTAANAGPLFAGQLRFPSCHIGHFFS